LFGEKHCPFLYELIGILLYNLVVYDMLFADCTRLFLIQQNERAFIVAFDSVSPKHKRPNQPVFISNSRSLIRSLRVREHITNSKFLRNMSSGTTRLELIF
jgi:hypothetical protein